MSRYPSKPGLVSVTLALVVSHLVVVSMAVGLRVEHVLADGALLGLVALGTRYHRVRAIAFVLLPFWLTGFAYEAVKLLLPLRGEIHIGDLFAADLQLFGVTDAGGARITLTSALQQHTHPVLDVVTGLAYIAYVLVPLGLVLLWAWRGQTTRANRLAWAFVVVNVAGFTAQLLWPAAPPWYVDQYGLGPAVMDAAPSAAGAARFDAALGVSYFANFYSRNVNIFGAMPSLHVAYPVLAALACAGLGLRWFIPTAALAALVGFSALYLNHHYVLDVLAGVAFAVLAYLIVAGAQRRLTASRSEA